MKVYICISCGGGNGLYSSELALHKRPCLISKDDHLIVFVQTEIRFLFVIQPEINCSSCCSQGQLVMEGAYVLLGHTT